MYRVWKKKTNVYCKETKALARNIESRLQKVTSKSELNELHTEWLAFVGFHDGAILDAHWNLETFWDSKVWLFLLDSELIFLSATSWVKLTKRKRLKRLNQRKSWFERKTNPRNPKFRMTTPPKTLLPNHQLPRLRLPRFRLKTLLKTRKKCQKKPLKKWPTNFY